MSEQVSKALSIDEDGRVRISQAAPRIAHAKKTVGGAYVKLTAGLPNRRKLYIKPVRTGGDRIRYIETGPHNFTLGEGTQVWEAYELVLDVGPDVEIYALRGLNVPTNVDVEVRLIEIGED